MTISPHYRALKNDHLLIGFSNFRLPPACLLGICPEPLSSSLSLKSLLARILSHSSPLNVIHSCPLQAIPEENSFYQRENLHFNPLLHAVESKLLEEAPSLLASIYPFNW